VRSNRPKKTPPVVSQKSSGTTAPDARQRRSVANAQGPKGPSAGLPSLPGDASQLPVNRLDFWNRLASLLAEETTGFRADEWRALELIFKKAGVLLRFHHDSQDKKPRPYRIHPPTREQWEILCEKLNLRSNDDLDSLLAQDRTDEQDKGGARGDDSETSEEVIHDQGATEVPSKRSFGAFPLTEPDDLRAVLEASIQGRIHLVMYLGLWDGKGQLPSRFEEGELDAAEPRLKHLIQETKEHIHAYGLDRSGLWLHLLRFLRTIVMDQAFDEERGSHPYKKELRKRYRNHLEDVLRAAVPHLPKREKRVPANLLEEFIDVCARLLEIRRRVRARLKLQLPGGNLPPLDSEERARQSDYLRRRKSSTMATFPKTDVHLLFPKLPAELINALSEDNAISLQKRGRRLGSEAIAVQILAYRHKASEATIRSWLLDARFRDAISERWGHVERLRQRLLRRAARYAPEAPRGPDAV
jgi:hypothetical protein